MVELAAVSTLKIVLFLSAYGSLLAYLIWRDFNE